MHCQISCQMSACTEEAPVAVALINGGFELGLTTGWGDSLSQLGEPTWQRVGDSQALASIGKGGYQSARSLRIKNSGPSDPQRYGELAQEFPVEEGATYELSCWLRADAMRPSALVIVVNGKEEIEFTAAVPQWQRFATRFIVDEANCRLAIRCQGGADVWLDEIGIRRVVE